MVITMAVKVAVKAVAMAELIADWGMATWA